MHFNAGEPSREERFSTLITRVLNFICFSQKHNIKDIIEDYHIIRNRKGAESDGKLRHCSRAM